jgi:hypothetical protein
MSYINNIIFLVFFTLFISSLITGGQLSKKGLTQEELDERVDILNVAEKNLTTEFDLKADKANVSLTRIIYKMTSFVVFTSFEAGKGGLAYGYENPDLDYKALLNIINAVFMIWAICMLTKPLIYILFFCYYLITNAISFVHRILNKNANR